MHSVQITPETFSRLQAHAVPLVDTIETVINRALDSLEGGKPISNAASENRLNPAAPPNLSFTTVRRVEIDGEVLSPADTYWNAALLHLVKIAARRGSSPKKIGELLLANNYVGRKTKDGYKFVAEAGISVQGQDANGAWRSIYYLAKNMKIDLRVDFLWQNNPKAAFPGQASSLSA